MTTSETEQPFSDSKLAVLYPLAAACGVLAGLLQIFVADPLFTALAVTAFTMAFAVARPLRPWRWLLLVGLPVPLTMVAGTLLNPLLHYTRATIAGSVLIMLPGFAGSYGGSFLRRVIRTLFQEK